MFAYELNLKLNIFCLYKYSKRNFQKKSIPTFRFNTSIIFLQLLVPEKFFIHICDPYFEVK